MTNIVMKRGRWIAGVFLFVLLIAILAILLSRLMNGERTTPSIDRVDEITGQRMSNVRAKTEIDMEIRVWIDGEYLRPTGAMNVYVDIIPIHGVHSEMPMSFVATDSTGRQWNRSVSLKQSSATRHVLRNGQVVFRHQLENPFGGGFNATVCSPEGNEIEIVATINWDPPREIERFEPMRLRPAPR